MAEIFIPILLKIYSKSHIVAQQNIWNNQRNYAIMQFSYVPLLCIAWDQIITCVKKKHC